MKNPLAESIISMARYQVELKDQHAGVWPELMKGVLLVYDETVSALHKATEASTWHSNKIMAPQEGIYEVYDGNIKLASRTGILQTPYYLWKDAEGKLLEGITHWRPFTPPADVEPAS